MSEEEIMKILKDTINLFNNDTYCFTHSDDERTEAIQGLLDLYNKEKKKNESLIKENLEIRDWKYVIDSPIDLDKLKELDLIKIKGKEYVSKDKIRDLLHSYSVTDERFMKYLQELLEERN